MSSNKVPNTDPLVFIHGLFGSLSDETLLIHYREKRVLAPDLLGYGRYRQSDVSSLSLFDQAEHVLAYMDNHDVQKANLVGHSVGGAVAALLAIHHPDRVKVLVSVEGNMTPPDSFWSASLATKSIDEIKSIVDGYYADVAAWISEAGVQANPETVRVATDWLDYQPAATLKAQARAVVKATSDRSGFIGDLMDRLEKGLVLHMISGANSRIDWHVPSAIKAAAKTDTVIHGSGHLMMLESPSKFAQVVLNTLEH